MHQKKDHLKIMVLPRHLYKIVIYNKNNKIISK